MKINLILILVLILSSCSIPQNVKDASNVHYESQKLFVKENAKFYATIEEALIITIDAQISFLENSREKAILITKEGIDEANEAVKKSLDLSPEDKMIHIARNERRLNEDILKFTRETDEEIQVQKERKRRVKNSILLLNNMQHELANSNMKLNEYIQLKRASDLLLDEVKSTFPQLKTKLADFETIIQDF